MAGLKASSARYKSTLNPRILAIFDISIVPLAQPGGRYLGQHFRPTGGALTTVKVRRAPFFGLAYCGCMRNEC